MGFRPGADAGPLRPRPAHRPQALAFARADARIPHVTFLLPPSRTRLRGLERLGARFVGAVDYEGRPFRKYRLDTG